MASFNNKDNSSDGYCGENTLIGADAYGFESVCHCLGCQCIPVNEPDRANDANANDANVTLADYLWYKTECLNITV